MISFLKNASNYLKRKKHYSRSLAFYKQFFSSDDLVFDIGANIGERSQLFLEIGAKVICVEPQINCLKILHEKFDGNKNVVIVDKALGESEGEGSITICETDHTISTMSDKWKAEGRFSNTYTGGQNVKVSVSTLDNLIEKYGLPKFCKIDVEGFEVSVIKGLSKKIPFISFEFTREFLKDAEDILRHLSAIGDVEVNFSLGESMMLFDKQWISSHDMFSQINKMDDQLLWGDVYIKFK